MKCKIRDLNIYYESIGEGMPVVMIHGFITDHRILSGCMESVFEHLKGYKRLYLDLPGMGKTKAKDWIKNSDDMLKVIADFINTVIPNENFLLVGQSCGGFLARGLINKMPEKISGLFLLCPVVIANKKERELPSHISRCRNVDLLKKLHPDDAAVYDKHSIVQNEMTWARYKNECLSGIKIADNDFIKNFVANGYEFSFKLDNNIVYDKPTLILLGHQDTRVGYKDAWKIFENYPKATFSILDQAGHDLQIDKENVFNCLVIDWLKRSNLEHITSII
ncbi:alpha/beta fold hydrolase [Propionispira raffinosivorans]|uniref:alpha/beta fold hydrolase n=1 Tax=Propionispira raffinosivorans TaxID=86959 RepID=UPI00036FCA3C|nr:alpha/beta hydrolase [Propionispira raffinosivorans]